MLKKFKGVDVYVSPRFEGKPDSAIWFTPEEWDWCLKLGSAMHEAEQKKEFWEGVVENKKLDPHYCLFVQFPQEEMNEAQKIALEYVTKIKAQLMGKK